MDLSDTKRQLLLGAINPNMLQYHLILYLIYSLCWCQEGMIILERSVNMLPQKVWDPFYLAEIIIKPVNTIVNSLLNMRREYYTHHRMNAKLIQKKIIILRFVILEEYFKALSFIQNAPGCIIQFHDGLK